MNVHEVAPNLVFPMLTKNHSSNRSPENMLASTRAKRHTLQHRRDYPRSSARSNPQLSPRLNTTREYTLKNRECRNSKTIKNPWTMEILRINLWSLHLVAEFNHKSSTKEKTMQKLFMRRVRKLIDHRQRNISSITIHRLIIPRWLEALMVAKVHLWEEGPSRPTLKTPTLVRKCAMATKMNNNTRTLCSIRHL